MLFYVESGANPKKSFTNVTMRMLLGLVAVSFNLRPSLKKYLKTAEGWLNFTAGITTESGSVACAIEFNNGRVKEMVRIAHPLFREQLLQEAKSSGLLQERRQRQPILDANSEKNWLALRKSFKIHDFFLCSLID